MNADGHRLGACGARTRAWSIRAGMRTRGARTRACRVHTRVNAWRKFRIGTRPSIILDAVNQTCLHGIPLDVLCNSPELGFISHPVIIRLALPELLPGSAEKAIRLASSRPFQSLQQFVRGDQRLQKNVNVIGHQNERAEVIMSQLHAAEQRSRDNFGDIVASQRHRTRARGIQVTIDPDEYLPAAGFSGRRKRTGGDASVQVPSEEEPAILRVKVGEAAVGVHRNSSTSAKEKFSRSHECERGTQECVRHNHE